MSNAKTSNRVEKKFKTSITLQYIFERPQLFQKLIEQSDLTGDTCHQMGFSQYKYELLLREFLVTHAADEQARYKGVCSLENLKQCNLLIDWDKGNKRLTFCDGFIELIRLSDETNKLIKEVSDIEYKGMLEEMKRLRDKLSESGLKSTDEDLYYDVRHAIFNHLRRIRSSIRTNEIKFETISKRLADMSSGITDDEIAYAKAKREMYSNASKIYERHIKPTVEFLDKSSRIEGGNLFVVLNDIGEIFNKRREYSHAEELQFSTLNLSNSYKPIETIAREVRKFLSITRDNARAYNAFEKIGEHLTNAINDIKGKSMNSRTLVRNTELLDVFNFYQGAEGTGALNAQSQIVFSDNPVFFKNMRLELQQLTALKGEIKELEIVDVELRSDTKALNKEVSDYERAVTLSKILQKMELRETGDLYALLHDRLESTLPQYSFFDLDTAKRRITEKVNEDGFRIVPTGFREQIQIGDKSCTYNVRKLKARDNE